MSGRRPLVMSGGQTGADRAALDAALAAGLGAGGWCPGGRWAEDGVIPARYPLRECASADPVQRTFLNVRDSGATLVLGAAADSPGTAATLAAAQAMGRPHLAMAPDGCWTAATLWLRGLRVDRLNVAGPRESEWPGLYAVLRPRLEALFRAWAGVRRPSRPPA